MSAPIRILCCSNMYPSADSPDYGAFVRGMCEALAARGDRVSLAAIRSRRGGPLATPAKYARLAASAVRRSAGVDVIYAHYLFPTGAVAALAGSARRTPWVVTAHGGDVRNLGRRSIALASAPGIRRAAAIIAVSRHLAGDLRASGIRLPPVHVINMGVDTDLFRPADRRAARARLGLPADEPLVLAVGGLTPRKNPLGLLRAVAELRGEIPGIRVALVGDGPLAGEVDAEARRLGLAGRLHRPGAVPHDRVPLWMAAADALAMVSTIEPLGQVALEALASGRPVVATRVGGAVEIVPEDGAGRHVDPGRPGEIAGALAELIRAGVSPETCRAAAMPHELSRQAGRVHDVLAGAAA
jgi:glycosyltransferase involved in cell wall biosynthesis